MRQFGSRRPRTRIRARAAVLVSLLLVAVCAGHGAARAAIPNGRALKSRDDTARRHFEAAIDQFVAKHLDVAEKRFRELARHPYISDRGREVVEFMIGKCLYEQGKFASCRDQFSIFLEAHPQSEYAAAAHVYVGHCSFQTGDHLRAVHAYASAISEASDDRHAEIARRNLEPLARWSLSSSDLEYLLTNLEPGEGSNWVRVLIADRWMEEGRVRLATDLYREVSEAARRSPPGHLAAERLRTMEDGTSRRRITVGILAPLSGDFESYGRDMAWAAEMAAESAGGAVQVLLRDTYGDSAKAVQLVDSLIDARCHVVIGPLLPEAIQGTLEPLRKEGVVQILPLARREGYTDGLPYTFQLSASPGEQARVLAEYATAALGDERICALVSDSPEGREAATAFVTTAEEHGAEVFPVQYFTPGDTDFGVQLRLLKSMTSPPGSDTLDEDEVVPLMDGMLVWGDPEDLILIIPQIVFHRYHVHLYGTAACGDPSIRQRVRSSLDSTYFISYEWVDPTRLAWRAFEKSFRDRWGSVPTSLAGRVYDIIRWLDVIAQQDPTPRRITQQLMNSEGYDGVSGKWQFNANHRPAFIPLLRYIDGVPARIASP